MRCLKLKNFILFFIFFQNLITNNEFGMAITFILFGEMTKIEFLESKPAQLQLYTGQF